MKGQIVRLKNEKGFGFIKGADGKEYFFHSSALKNCRYESLAVAQEVEFEPSEGDKGLRAEDVYA